MTWADVLEYIPDMPNCTRSVCLLTGSLAPGSLTVVNCSSLYFWYAGPRDETSPLPVIDLMAIYR